MSEAKKYLLALGSQSLHNSAESLKIWKKHGVEIVFAQNDRAVINMSQSMDFKLVFLENTFCPNSIRLLDWGVRNTQAAWVYSIRGEFLQSLSQLALQKGAKCVLHDPKTIERLLLRIGIDHQRKGQSSVSADPFLDKINLATAEIATNGKFKFKPTFVSSDRFERRHAEWLSFIKSSNANSEQSFNGYDAYQEKYSQLLRNISVTLENTEVSFVTLRPRSVLDKSNSGVRVLISSHDNDSFPQKDISPLENAKLPEVIHTVRTQEAVLMKKQISDCDGKITGHEFSASIPIYDSNHSVSGVLLARRNAESTKPETFVRNTFDLSSFAPKLQRPFQCLEYFSRIYSGKTA